MPRVMQDSVNTANFTDGADIYAGYVLSDTGHGYSNYQSMVARFPNSMHLSICTRFNATAQCLDYEGGTTGTGPAEAQQAVAWTVRMRANGLVPWNYCNQSTWPSLRAAYSAAGVAEPIWWIANTNTGPVMIPGAAAHQYTFNLPANPYDTSVVADTIPGFDGLAPSGGGTLEDELTPDESQKLSELYRMVAGLVNPTSNLLVPSVGEQPIRVQLGDLIENGAEGRRIAAELITGVVPADAAAVGEKSIAQQVGVVAPSTQSGPQSGTYTYTPEA